MTSKKALEKLCEMCSGSSIKCHKKDKCTIFKSIEKDLKVLDILKKYVLTADLLDNDTKVFRINALFMWDDAGYKEIKRWMEENE